MSAAWRTENSGGTPGALSPRRHPGTPGRRTSRWGLAGCAVVLGGHVGGLGFTPVGVPWWAYCSMQAFGAAVLCLRTVIPQDSPDRLALWREWLETCARRRRAGEEPKLDEQVKDPRD